MKKIIFAACALFMIAACSKSEEGSTPNYELHLSTQIATRAEGTTWHSGDQIGVFMFAQGSTTNVGAEENAPYKTSQTGAQVFFEAVETQLYYPQEGKVDILAYYPYSKQLQGKKILLDVSEQQDLATIDLMSATKSGVEKNEIALALSFVHRLARIVVKLVPGDGVSTEDLLDAQISLEGLALNAEYDLVNQEIALGEGQTTAIILNTKGMNAQNLAAEGILLPQSKDFTLSVEMSKYGRLSTTFQDKSFIAEKEHVYTITVDRKGIDTSNGSVEIQDWVTEDEAYLDADNTGGR